MPGETIGFELIAGLGNPGNEHENDRHNAGFWFVDELARQLGASFSTDKRFFAATASGFIGHRKVHLVKPMNYMNNRAGCCGGSSLLQDRTNQDSGRAR